MGWTLESFFNTIGRIPSCSEELVVAWRWYQAYYKWQQLQRMESKANRLAKSSALALEVIIPPSEKKWREWWFVEGLAYPFGKWPERVPGFSTTKIWIPDTTVKAVLWINSGIEVSHVSKMLSIFWRCTVTKMFTFMFLY